MGSKAIKTPTAAPADAPRARSLVRLANLDELDILVGFQLDSALELENLRLDEGTVAAAMRAIFAHPTRGHYWIIAEGLQLQGMLLTSPEWSDWRNSAVLWIRSVYVRPEARGRGLFRQFYEFLQELVRNDPDLHGLRLYVDRPNKAAQQVYQAMGMTGGNYELYEWLA